MKRRDFIKRVAQGSAVVSAISAQRVLGANERIGIGIIGFGLIGRLHARNFHALSGSRVTAVADVFQPRLDASVESVGGDGCAVSRLPQIVGRQERGRRLDCDSRSLAYAHDDDGVRSGQRRLR